MRALIIAILLVPAVAEAGHHRRCTVSVTGYCGAFGAWRHGVTMAFDVGMSALRFTPDRIDATRTVLRDGAATAYAVRPADGEPHPLGAIGARVRLAFGVGRTLYVVGQTDLASVSTGPAVVADLSAAGTTTTMSASTGGFVAQEAIMLGAHRRVGAFSLALESGLGARIAIYSTTTLPDTIQAPTQASVVVPLQIKLDWWLSPNVAIGALGGVDLLHRGDVTVGIVLGMHLMAFDGSR
jgi:hypothetical protein